MLFCDLSGLDPKLTREINKELYICHKPTDIVEEADIVLLHVEPFTIEPWFNCRYVVCPCTNTDHIIIKKAGVNLISLQCVRDKIENIAATAEHTIYLMLAIMRLNHCNRHQDPRQPLAGSRLLIIGHGRIGGIVSGIATCLGLDVYWIDENTSDDDKEDQLRIADIITLHTTCYPGMKPILGEKELSLIRDGAFIINTSRGEAIDEYALKDQMQRYGGVAVDTLCGEPNPPALEALASHNNFIYTYHTGGWESGSLRLVSKFCFKELERLMNEA
jgi:phosphoglycerate dehydrogenase-like enzyme